MRRVVVGFCRMSRTWLHKCQELDNIPDIPALLPKQKIRLIADLVLSVRGYP